jgi:hypothetical protein
LALLLSSQHPEQVGHHQGEGVRPPQGAEVEAHQTEGAEEPHRKEAEGRSPIGCGIKEKNDKIIKHTVSLIKRQHAHYMRCMLHIEPELAAVAFAAPS